MQTNVQQAEQKQSEQGKDDGMRFKCSTCETYVKPDPEGSGMKCDACGEYFVLCDDCSPEWSKYLGEAVWLCPQCR
jgi:DNA-directed RNA polymerase subunit RPC12/RpoP